MSAEQAPKLQSIDGKEHEDAVKVARKTIHEKAEGRKDGHILAEEVQYAVENAFSWPVSLVMGLDHNDHSHSHVHSHEEHRHGQLPHDDKETQHAVENAFSWPVSLAMSLIHESRGHKGVDQGNQKKPESKVREGVENAKNTLMVCCMDTTSS